MKISKEAITGIVVIVTLIIFYFLFNFLKGKDLLVKGDVYYVDYENVNGLLPSKAVTVNGLRVGRVDEIKIIDTDVPIHFVVKIKLERKLDFGKGTVAEIYETGLMSGKEIRLLLDYEGDRAKTGDTLAGRLNPSFTSILSDELAPTKNKLDSLMHTSDRTLRAVEKLMDEENSQNIKSILKNLNTTLLSFNETSKSLTRTSDNANKLVIDNKEDLKGTLKNINSMLAATQETVKKYGDIADKLSNSELEQIIKNFEEASSNLNELMTKMSSGEGTLGALMSNKELYNNLNETSNSLNELLKDFKENPNRYVQFSIFGKKQKVEEN